MIYAPVNKIINFSNVDGPGNRMSIFFQKCPNKCLFCHNPETINMCINCGDCVDGCPVNALKMVDGKVLWDSKVCVNCDNCIKTCKHLSSPKINQMSTDDLFELIQKRKSFIQGITVSGGECMEYPEFLLELFTKVKSIGLTCLIDSSGYYDFSEYKELLDVCDGVMLDMKAWDKEFYQYLGADNYDTVISNLHYLLEINKITEVRTVLFTDKYEMNKKTVLKIAEIMDNRATYKLLRYRPFGVRKSGLKELGEKVFPVEEAEELKELAKAKGWDNIVVV